MQAEYLDRLSHAESIIHRIDARWKMIAAAAMIVVVVAMPGPWWYGFLVLAAIVAGCYLMARLPWSYLLKRLAIALPFLLVVAVSVPLSRGFADGFDIAAVILVRALLSLTVMLTLVATTRYASLLAALSWFRVPRLLILILAFMYRYLFVLADELSRMRRAKLARSYGWNLWSEMQLLSNFVGVLFIRSFERAERVHAAMCARGWKGDLSNHELL